MGDMLDLSGLSPDQLAAALEGPALPPPNGTVSDFDHPPNDNALAHGVLATCLAVNTLMLALRFYARFLIARRVYLEDGKNSI